MKCHLRVLIAILCVVVAPASWAEDDDMDDLFSMSLDDLANIEVSLASISAKPIREQSAIVSVITAKEIQASGARDLVDVLMLVPGYHFGVDVEGVTGVGIRGFWAYEGKTLITLDGIDIVESLFGIVPLDEHIPVDQIEQIEIIRGPGSAMYGGNAELSVINIVTKGAKLNGGLVSTDFGTDGQDVSNRNSFSAGWGEGDLHMHAGVSHNSSYRSTSKYTDQDGTVIDLDENSDITSTIVNAGVDYKDFEFRFLYDVYHLSDITEYGWVQPRYSTDFDSFGASMKYDFKLAEKFTITPKIVYNFQEPWFIDVPGGDYHISTDRYTGNITAVGKLGAGKQGSLLGWVDSFDVLAGAEIYREGARADKLGAGGEGMYYEKGTKRRVHYENYSEFAQAELGTKWVDVTVGGRYHYHSELGGKFVPRAALTKAWDKFHAKALFSQAFRTPQIEVIQFGAVDGGGDPTIKPEITTSWELETGYRLSDTVSLVVNAFRIEVADILVYSGILDSYSNFDEVTNYGAEAELRIADKWGNATLGYSFYRNHHNDVPAFCTKGGVFGDGDYEDCKQDDGLLLGFPAHKLTLSGTYFLDDHWSLNLNGAYISKRISYAVGMAERKTLGSQVYANLFLQYQKDGFSIGAGVRDLFDKQYDFVQPFDSGVRELPGKGREFFAKLSYAFDSFPF
jgi:outer membrane receptor for ferrienterochelin and colicin